MSPRTALEEPKLLDVQAPDRPRMRMRWIVGVWMLVLTAAVIRYEHQTLFTWQNLLGLSVATLFALLVVRTPKRLGAVRCQIVKIVDVAERYPRIAILVAGAFPVAVRLLALPWLPVPIPQVADEFGHLLVADTLMHGRLSNPPHPFWPHFEAIYILQQPSYASIYPLGQGALLAAGTWVTGHPWGAVCMSMALLGALMCWALEPWVGFRWSLLGGGLAGFYLGMGTYWMNTYWGGALAAIGGALILGAIGRMRTGLRLSQGMLMSAGWALVWFTRPFEALVLGLTLAALVGGWLLLDQKVSGSRLRALILPALSASILVGGITAMHNRAVTGSILKMPYVLSREQYGVPQTFSWQAAAPQPKLAYQILRDSYQWQYQMRKKWSGPAGMLRQLLKRISMDFEFHIRHFFLWTMLLLPLILTEPPMIAIFISLAISVVAGLVYPFYFPHYSAALAGSLLLLQIRVLQRVHTWSFRGWAAGKALVAIVSFTVVLAGVSDLVDRAVTNRLWHHRFAVEQQLRKLGGRHLVFVRYGRTHNFHEEWLYNAADIDHASIVWAAERDPESAARLRAYYPERTVWIADVDRRPPQLSRASE